MSLEEELKKVSEERDRLGMILEKQEPGKKDKEICKKYAEALLKEHSLDLEYVVPIYTHQSGNIAEILQGGNFQLAKRILQNLGDSSKVYLIDSEGKVCEDTANEFSQEPRVVPIQCKLPELPSIISPQSLDVVFGRHIEGYIDQSIVFEFLNKSLKPNGYFVELLFNPIQDEYRAAGFRILPDPFELKKPSVLVYQKL